MNMINLSSSKCICWYYQIDSASKPVGGAFSISLGGKSLAPILSDISASGFKLLLEFNYPDEGRKFLDSSC